MANYPFFDRVKETTSTGGTGDLILLGAAAGGFQAFGAVAVDGQALRYVVEDPTNNQWEVGRATYNFGANSLSRKTVTASSNGGSLVNFNSVTKNVFCDTIGTHAQTDALNLRDYGAKGDGVTDDTTAIKNWLTDVAASSHKRGYAPAGTYLVSGTTGNIFTLSADGMEIFGDGMGQTIFKHVAGVAGTQITNLGIFGNNYIGNADLAPAAGSRNLHLHHFSIQGDPSNGSANPNNTTNYWGISLTGAFECEVNDIEAFGGLNWTPFQDIQGWNQAEYVTTLGTTIASGAQTVTPASMNGIYVNRRLWITTTNPEIVTVTAITQTTFTATFANSHNSTDGVILRCGGFSRHYWHHNLVHDISKNANGSGGNGFQPGSNGSTYFKNVLRRIGTNSLCHGFYSSSAGYNFYYENTIIGAGGYSIQLRTAVNSGNDGSGNVILNNYSEDPGLGHFFADSGTSDGTNLELPNGTQINRYWAVIGNTMRLTRGGVLAGGSTYGVNNNANACDIIGNIFDDTGFGNAGWIIDTASGNTNILGNTFQQTNYTASTIAATGFPPYQIILILGTATIEGNTFNLSGGVNTAVIFGSANTRAIGNTIVGTICGQQNGPWNAVAINGCGVIRDNVINPSDSGTTGHPILLGGFVSGADISGNTLKKTDTTHPLFTFAGTETLSFHDNEIGSSNWVDVTTTGVGLKIYNNDGQIQYAGQGAASHGVALDRSAGRLLPFSKGTNTLTKGLLVAYTGGAVATIAAAANGTWDGVSPSDTDANSNGIYIAGGVGQIIPVTSDGAWTAGNVAISSTTAGKIHDTGGTTIPGSGSWGIFIDTGGAAGTAHVLVMKTR